MRIGIHTSAAGSLDRTALRAVELGCNTFQIFSASPRMWRAAPPSADAIREMRKVREAHDLAPLVIHDNYLINLGSRDPVIREKSISAYRGEVERAIAIGAEYLVAHPGSFKDRTLEDGIAAVVEGITEATRGLKSQHLALLLENTAGQGNTIGRRFEELAAIREGVAGRIEFAVGYCIDTCHSLAAGYDVATEKGLVATVAELDRVLGLDHVPVIHTNDSKGALGSNLDRHMNIGEGQIGLAGFRRILNHPKLKGKAFILETPIDAEGDDLRNIETLKQLCRKSPTSSKRSK